MAPYGTRLRNLRIPDNLWVAMKAKAESEGTTVTQLVIECMERYTGEAADYSERWTRRERDDG